MDIAQRLKQGRASTDEALEVFDTLEPADVDFMLGAWHGEGFDTGHPMDGLLEAYRWHGKRFESAEAVHPLVFATLRGRLACINPGLMGLSIRLMERLPMPKSAAAGRLFQCAMPLFKTSRPRARLRMTTYRGRSCATMIYDQLPVNDVFRRIDADTAFGLMDYRGMTAPFFFILRRDERT